MFDNIQQLLTPRLQQREQAAACIQCYVRGRLARRQQRYEDTMRRLIQLMQRSEVRAAVMMQRRWRGRRTRAERAYDHAVITIQAHAKGHHERQRMKAERQWAAESAAALKVAQREQLVSECTGIIEKRGRRLSLGPWEMNVWQERFVTVTDEAIVYQVRASAVAPPLTHTLTLSVSLSLSLSRPLAR
jgi:hypothetical protein